MSATAPGLEDLLRQLAPQVLATLTRRYRHFDLAEEATQEALLAAATQWPDEGIPENPAAWMTTVSARRMTDLLRSEHARRRREEREAVRALPSDLLAPAADVLTPSDVDDTLVLLYLCCHPAVGAPAQVALTLRAVGGLTTLEIARALLLPEATVAQRISRAKRRILESGARFAMPHPGERHHRTDVVIQVIYLIFTEGHTATTGGSLVRADLCVEAIRLGRLLHRSLPGTPEVSGLLAEMLLTDARRPSRVGSDGELVPLADQDRSRWDRASIDEGISLLTDTLRRHRPGPFQLQAAISAVHAESPTYADTDWRQIAALYQVLDGLADNPIVTVNRAVAVAQLDGPAAALTILETVASDPRLTAQHRLFAVRAHLLEQLGDSAAAAAEFLRAAQRTTSLPEQRYLLTRAAMLTAGSPDAG